MWVENRYTNFDQEWKGIDKMTTKKQKKKYKDDIKIRSDLLFFQFKTSTMKNKVF